MLPQIDRSHSSIRQATTQTGVRIKRKKRVLRQNRPGFPPRSISKKRPDSNRSFDVGHRVTNKTLAIISNKKLGKKNDKKPIWKPSGNFSKNDGYTPAAKLYF